MTMSMNTPISSENRWPHTLVVQIKWCFTGSGLSKIRQQKRWTTWNQTKTGNEDTKSDGWWLWMMELVTLRVTARHKSLCSYQCGNSGGVHWSVSRRHQHRLQNNRRERVIVHGMRMGTRGRTVGTTLFMLLFVHVFKKKNKKIAVGRWQVHVWHTFTSGFTAELQKILILRYVTNKNLYSYSLTADTLIILLCLH